MGSGLSSSLKPAPSGLTVAGRSRPPGFAVQTRILLPFGDQRGHSATPGRSWTCLVPSGFAVKIWKSPRPALNLPNTIWPFGPWHLRLRRHASGREPQQGPREDSYHRDQSPHRDHPPSGSLPDLRNIDALSRSPNLLAPCIGCGHGTVVRLGKSRAGCRLREIPSPLLAGAGAASVPWLPQRNLSLGSHRRIGAAC